MSLFLNGVDPNHLMKSYHETLHHHTTCSHCYILYYQPYAVVHQQIINRRPCCFLMDYDSTSMGSDLTILLGNIHQIAMETKQCIDCKHDFPKTSEYFYTRIVKYKDKRYTTVQSACKECAKKYSYAYCKQKRAAKYGISMEDYPEKIKTLRYQSMIEKKKGRACLSLRKYDYGHNNVLSLEERAKMRNEKMASSILAYNNKISVKDMSPFLLELIRKKITISRHVKHILSNPPIS